MKKWLFTLLAVALTVSSCGILSSETKEEKVAREAREAQLVLNNIQSGNFTIDIDRMYPIRGTSQHVTNYSVSVKNGELNSHLPYFGQAWRVPYGGGHGLTFKAPVVTYNVMNRNDGYEVRIYVKTDEDQHIYTLTVFPNGRASLDVQSQNRERISYGGMMDFYSAE